MADREALITQFTTITGVEGERARFYLESAAWQLDVAIASFYENDEDSGGAAGGVDIEELRADPVGQADVPPPKPKPATPPSRFGTLASLNRNNDESSDEEEGEAFYAGGSEHSGQQIVGPGKKKKDVVTEMFKSVLQHGAEVVDPKQPATGKRKSAFAGTGYRLGQTDDDTEVIPGRSNSLKPGSPRDVTLQLWKTGFSVDDGPLREYSDPENKEFLESIRRGEIPMELIREAQGGEIHLNMEDHRHEEYSLPKPRARAFGGKGHVLGSPAPATVSTAQPKCETDGASGEVTTQPSLTVNESEPVTSIQIRLADGSRLVGRFNHTHTVNDIRQYIVESQPRYRTTQFRLLLTFPNKELTDTSQSIKDAGLLNAAILQRVM